LWAIARSAPFAIIGGPTAGKIEFLPKIYKDIPGIARVSAGDFSGFLISETVGVVYAAIFSGDK
jgi:hypothetical protein